MGFLRGENLWVLFRLTMIEIAIPLWRLINITPNI